jgi:hypothetical protein
MPAAAPMRRRRLLSDAQNQRYSGDVPQVPVGIPSGGILGPVVVNAGIRWTEGAPH